MCYSVVWLHTYTCRSSGGHLGTPSHGRTGSHSEQIKNSLEDLVLECDARGSDGATYTRSNIARAAIFENCTKTELGDGTDSGDMHTNALIVCCVCYDEVALCGWVLEAKIALNVFRSAMYFNTMKSHSDFVCLRRRRMYVCSRRRDASSQYQTNFVPLYTP